MPHIGTGLGIVIFLVVVFLFMAIKILNEYERGVIFRLGRVIDHKGPGLILLIPVIDRMVRVSLRTVAMDVPPQDVITRDNVSVKVNAVIYFRVMEPTKAIIEVENYLYATSQLAQTTLRSVCGRERKGQRGTSGNPRPAYRTLGSQGQYGGSEADRSSQ